MANQVSKAMLPKLYKCLVQPPHVGVLLLAHLTVSLSSPFPFIE